MNSAELDSVEPGADPGSDITELLPILTKFVTSRVSDPDLAQDLVR
jgi:hypothetical protein